MNAASIRQLIETGTEPEYFVTHLGKHEPMENGMVRLYLATEKGGHLKLEYTVVVPVSALAAMGRLCLQIASDVHNINIFRDDLRQH